MWGSHLEFWTLEQYGLRFEKIGSMFSELVALASDGKLRRWKWDAAKPAEVRIIFLNCYKYIYFQLPISQLVLHN